MKPEVQKHLQEKIEEIIKNTFEKVALIYRHNQEGKKELNKTISPLVFPQYRNQEIRISEQELRFAFVDELCRTIATEKDLDLLYSIETPTERKYNFTNERKVDDSNCRSGRLDLTIYHAQTSKRICIIEFKANTPGKESYDQDFFKLQKELSNAGNEDSRYAENAFGYFVQIVKNTNRQTAEKIGEKPSEEIPDQLNDRIKYFCYSLEDGKDGKLIISK